MNRISRRRFLGSAMAAAGAGVTFPRLAAAHGRTRTLSVDTRTIDVAGRAARVLGITDSETSTPFHFSRDEPFHVLVSNRLPEPTLLHWHGLTPPWRQDGVPSLPHPPIDADTDHEFNFALEHTGTFWMHSHFGLQLQSMLAAPLIVTDPANAMRIDQDIVMMVHDFSFRAPDEILAELSGAHGNMTGMDHGSGTDPDMSDMPVHGNEFDHDAYLVNDRTLDDPQIVTVEANAKIRLRIVNAAASTGFFIDTGTLQAEVLAVDGQDVAPVTGRSFPLSPGQRIDLAVSIPTSGGAFPVLALREGARERTGLILASAGVPVAKLASVGDETAPLLDLAFERQLAAASSGAMRSADRHFNVTLTGSHQPYDWGIDMIDAGGARSTEIEYGERVELAIRNPTTMAHPMHLHGHRFQVVGIGTERFAGALRDTVIVPADTTVTVAFEANNPGRWAFHCHHLYHMAAGMMTTLDYRGSV